MKNKPRNSKAPRGFVTDTLVKGMLVLLPITIILLVLSIIFDFIFDLVAPMSSLLQPGQQEPHWIFSLLAICILAAFVFLVGVLIKNKLGRTYFQVFEKRYLKPIPLYNLVHETVYQFAGVKNLPFSEAVIIDPFSTGTLMTGFITDRINEDLYCIFVPTAPNPTNGNIYHVKKEAITFLDVAPQDAMRTVIGMGTGTAKLFESYKPSNREVQPQSKNV